MAPVAVTLLIWVPPVDLWIKSVLATWPHFAQSVTPSAVRSTTEAAAAARPNCAMLPYKPTAGGNVVVAARTSMPTQTNEVTVVPVTDVAVEPDDAL